MESKLQEDTRYYDRWTVPSNLTLANGARLREFMFEMQDLMRKGRYESVFLKAECLLSDFKIDKDRNYECAFIMLLLGIAKRKCGQPDVAREFISQANRIFEIYEDNENSIRSLLAMGDTWRAQALMTTDPSLVKNNWKKAQKYYGKSWGLYQNFSKPPHAAQRKAVLLLRIQILWAQARANLVLGETSHSVESTLLKVWEVSSRVDSIWAQEEVAQLLGRYYEKNIELMNAEYWYKIALKRAEKSSNVDRLIESCLYLAKLKKQTNKYVEAKKYMNLAEKTLLPLLTQKIPKNHQFYKFQKEIVDLREAIRQIKN